MTGCRRQALRTACVAVVLTALASTANAAPACVDARALGRMLLSDVRGLATEEWLPLGLGLGAAALVHPLDDNADR